MAKTKNESTYVHLLKNHFGSGMASAAQMAANILNGLNKQIQKNAQVKDIAGISRYGVTLSNNNPVVASTAAAVTKNAAENTNNGAQDKDNVVSMKDYLERGSRPEFGYAPKGPVFQTVPNPDMSSGFTPKLT